MSQSIVILEHWAIVNNLKFYCYFKKKTWSFNVNDIL